MKNNLIFSFLLCLVTTAATAVVPSSSSQVVKAFYAAVDAGNFDQAASFLSDGMKAYIPFSPTALDKMGYKQLGMGMKAGFPDMRHTILDVSESEGTIAFKALFTGTNTGSLQGNPPTGNRVETPFLGFFKMDKNGLIAEVNLQFDVAGFNAQLMKGINPTEMNHALAERIFAALNRHDLDAVVAEYAPSAIFSGWGPQPLDVDGYKKQMSDLMAAFPDGRFTIDDMVSEGDRLVIRHHLEGTHTGGPFLGVAVSNKKVFVPATVTIRLQNGKPQEFWLNADFLGLMMQIGAPPTPKN